LNSIGSEFTPRLQLPLSDRMMQLSQNAQAADNQPKSFTDLLAGGVMQVNGMQQDANDQVHELLTGGDVNQIEVFTAVQKADMAFRMLVQVRNKLLSAYEEINAIRI
jgi:flagellar hook-basal body complex protein FliE